MRGLRPPFRKLAGGLLLLAIAGGLGCRAARPVPPPPAAFRGDLVGSPLPPLDVKEWIVPRGPAAIGTSVHPLILLFWNYQDAASLEALDLVARIAREKAGTRLLAFTIHTDIGTEEFQTPGGALALLRKRGIDLPSALDRGTTTLALCRVHDVPSLVFVDGRGIVRGVMSNYRHSRDAAIAQFVDDALLP